MRCDAFDTTATATFCGRHHTKNKEKDNECEKRWIMEDIGKKCSFYYHYYGKIILCHNFFIEENKKSKIIIYIKKHGKGSTF